MGSKKYLTSEWCWQKYPELFTSEGRNLFGREAKWLWDPSRISDYFSTGTDMTWTAKHFDRKFSPHIFKDQQTFKLVFNAALHLFCKKKIEKPKSVFLNVFFWTKHNWSLEIKDQCNPHGYKQCDWLCLNNLAPSYYCYFNVVCTALAASLTKPITVFEYYQDFSKWAQANFTWGNLKGWCKICRVYVLQLETAL